MNMLKRQNNRGFTMMETLVVTAIVVILMGVAFIAVQNYQRSMKQLELDKTARELFIAAQNHLTAAEAQGLLTERTSAAEKEPENADRIVGQQDAREGGTYHYYVVGTDYSTLTDKTVLRDMLPSFSIDDTVRLGGSYVVEYDLESATVTNVFYSDKSNLSSHVFSITDLGALFKDPSYVGDGKSAARLQGFKGDGNAIIGWYGGENAKDIARIELYAPKVEIINGEKLEAKVSFTRSAITRMSRDAYKDVQISIIIEGKTSHSKRSVALSTISIFNLDASSEVVGVTAYRSCRYVLDDITSQKDHFANKWCTASGVSDDQMLIPGEDITITVKVLSNSALANIEERSAGPENSLFASVKSGEAEIANFRHLENLSPEISGYSGKLLQDQEAEPVTKAKQLRSLAKEDGSEDDYSWDGFKKAISTGAPGSVRIYKLSGNAADASKAGTFMPIVPTYQNEATPVHYLTNYDGNSFSIDGVTIDNATDAGLFGSLNNCEVSNLELRDFNVQTSSGNAGSLVGTGSGLTVTNVLTRNTVSDDSGLEIKGSGSVGGLMGQVSNTSVDKCAAAVYVSSSGSVAGGLVGKITDNSYIKNSYAGGHTKDGAYTKDTTGTARINVQAATKSGGLVGEATFTAGDVPRIQNSYATTSVKGENLAGGLVGSATYGKIDKCYATGLVVAGDGKAGTIAGSASGTAFSDCKYFSIINEGMNSVAGSENAVTGVTAFDATAQEYNSFFRGTEAAKPYDSTLTKYYQDKYTFQTVKQLSGANDMTDFVTTHYGDWPAPEVLVVNVPNT